MKFKPGDTVKLKKSSKYYYQAKEVIGKIRNIQEDYDDGFGPWMGVNFNNGYRNAYHERDLELLETYKKEIKPYPVVAFLERSYT